MPRAPRKVLLVNGADSGERFIVIVDVSSCAIGFRDSLRLSTLVGRPGTARHKPVTHRDKTAKSRRLDCDAYEFSRLRSRELTVGRRVPPMRPLLTATVPPRKCDSRRTRATGRQEAGGQATTADRPRRFRTGGTDVIFTDGEHVSILRSKLIHSQNCEEISAERQRVGSRRAPGPGPRRRSRGPARPHRPERLQRAHHPRTQLDSQLMFTVAPLIVTTRDSGAARAPPRGLFTLVRSMRRADFGARLFARRDTFFFAAISSSSSKRVFRSGLDGGSDPFAFHLDTLWTGALLRQRIP